MSTISAPSVVLFVNDVGRMRTFYQRLAAITVLHDAEDHAVLAVNGLELVIHALPKHVVDEWPVATPPKVREDTYLKLCLPVDNILSSRSIAESLGGQIKPASAEWSSRGFRACDGYDPEGNVIQVREPAG